VIPRSVWHSKIGIIVQGSTEVCAARRAMANVPYIRNRGAKKLKIIIKERNGVGMAFCTRCGAPLTEGVPHECSEAEKAVAAASAAGTTSSGAAQASGAGQWFNAFVQYVKLGIKDPEALSNELERSGDLPSVILFYLIPGLLFGIFVVLFAKKAISSIIGALGLDSMFTGILSVGGIGGYTGFDNDSVVLHHAEIAHPYRMLRGVLCCVLLRPGADVQGQRIH
jgi:hypothetical protein